MMAKLHAQNRFITGEIFIKIRDTFDVELVGYDFSWSGINKAFQKYEVNTHRIEKPFSDSVFNRKLAKIYKVFYNPKWNGDSLCAQLMRVPCVEFAEKIPLPVIQYTPNDLKPQQWYLRKIHAGNAWEFGKGSYLCRVAIIDNAILRNHNDLVGNIWSKSEEIPGNHIDEDSNGYVDDYHGYDVADGDEDVSPPASISDSSAFNHGTLIAGLCSAVTDNGKGIAGLGFRTSLLPIKCTPDTAADPRAVPFAYEGLYYAAKFRPNMVCIAWGSRDTSATMHLLLQVLRNENVFVIAAAGNDSIEKLRYPASSSLVFSVGACDSSDRLSAFSNYHKNLDALAPGTSIYSTMGTGPNNYGYVSGTSSSAALTCGLAGLLKYQSFSYTVDQMTQIIRKGCDDITASNPGKTDKIGAGRINAYRTINSNAASTEKLNSNEFLIYPNPSKGEFSVKSIVSNSVVRTIVLIDMAGNEVYADKNIHNGLYRDYSVHCNSLKPGIYTLMITSDLGISTIRLTVFE